MAELTGWGWGGGRWQPVPAQCGAPPQFRRPDPGAVRAALTLPGSRPPAPSRPRAANLGALLPLFPSLSSPFTACWVNSDWAGGIWRGLDSALVPRRPWRGLVSLRKTGYLGSGREKKNGGLGGGVFRSGTLVFLDVGVGQLGSVCLGWGNVSQKSSP